MVLNLVGSVLVNFGKFRIYFVRSLAATVASRMKHPVELEVSVGRTLVWQHFMNLARISRPGMIVFLIKRSHCA